MSLMIKITENGEGNENDLSIKFEAKIIKWSLCDYSDAYILLGGDKTATGGNENTAIAFKNCAPFIRCVTHTNDEQIDTADNHLDIIMPMYNLIEYSGHYLDKSWSFWEFKRDESYLKDAGNPAIVTTVIKHPLNTNQVAEII